ncbi:MAG TPA: hypothetical protein VGR97_07220 [Candidatus Acidoferrales bacterium]|nr:hypothetical protein [Candidatus Acidoferrales bacterium]
MTNGKELIESARNWHKLSLIVAATALVLLFAPAKVDYRKALNEAYLIRDLKISDYERFVRGFIGTNSLLPSTYAAWGLWERDITSFLDSKLDFKVQDGEGMNPDWKIVPILSYDAPPTNGAIQDWQSWITSSKTVSYFHPDWGTARLSVSRDHASPPPVVRHFWLGPSGWRRFPGEYTFRAYLDLNPAEGDSAKYVGVPPKRIGWWTPLDDVESRDLWSPPRGRGLGENQFIVEGDLGSQLREACSKCNIRDWLKQSGLWSQLSLTGSTGEIVLPGIREHWSELREKPLQDAITLMEQKQKEIQDVSLLGLPVPGQLCVVAVPLAFLVINLFLLLDLRFLRRIQKGQDLGDAVASSPWMGLYTDGAARWTAVLSIAVAPTALALGLLVKYYPRVGTIALIIGVVSSLAAFVVQIQVVRTASTIRRKLPTA